MTTTQILNVLKQQSLAEKLLVMEALFKDIRKETLSRISEKETRKNAALALLNDYQEESELVSFTVLDNEKFYEA